MQTPSPAPWTTTKSSDQFFQVSGAYGYASEGKMSNGILYSGRPGTAHLEQTGLTVCAGHMYELSFMFGRGDINGNGLCKLTTTLSGTDIAPVTLFSGYPCEPSSPCTLKNGWAGNYAFLRVTTDVGPFSATTAAGSLTITTDWDCSGITAGQSAKIHSADNYYLMRKD